MTQVSPFILEEGETQAFVNPPPEDSYPEVPYWVEAVRPEGGLRAAWRALWDRTPQPRLRVHRRMNLKMMDDALRENYVDPIKEQLNYGRGLLVDPADDPSLNDPVCQALEGRSELHE